MQYYNAKDLARSFRTVRANTIRIAEEIPEKQYDFRPAPGVRSVAETLAHIAVGTRFTKRFQSERPSSVEFAQFAAALERMTKEEGELKTRDQILAALRADGDEFASWLDTLPDDVLAEQVRFPEGVQPPSKTRFEMLLGVKEHEMHHRAQLMVAERMIGIVPHLTRDFEARRAEIVKQMQAGKGA
jgi:uncharacterized damage-inducible protein DinB